MDRVVFERIELVLTDLKLAVTNASLQAGAGAARAIPYASVGTDENLRQIFALEAKAVTAINLTLNNNLSFSYTRPNESAFDVLTITNNSNSPEVELQAARLIDSFKNHFDVYDTTESLSQLLPDQVKAFQEGREIILGRLQEINENLVRTTADYRTELDRRADDLRQKLDLETQEKKASLDVDFEKRLAALQGRETQLDERVREIDARESRTARRGIRKDLQTELTARAREFTLTEGTRRLRLPIHVTCIVVGTFLGVLTAINFYYGILLFTSPERAQLAQIIIFAVKQVVVTSAFAGIWTYYIRWTNQWFNQHAKEEFRLKRLGIDIDWANWVVETAMEWQQEIKSPIPTDLLTRLTGNLFAEDVEKQEQANPADQLASAILGSAASATIEAAGGKITFDKKGIDKLSDSKKEK